MSYEVIVFDLGNTIIRFDHNISARKIANLFHLDIKKIYDAFFDSEMTRAFEKGDVSPKEFYGQMVKFLGIKLSYEDFVPIWNEIFWEDTASCGIAKSLKKDYRLFLLSNVNRLHYEHIRNKFDILNIFDETILSFLLGSMKPERRIYDEVIKRSGERKEKLLYIDDREDLITAARKLGIDSIRYEGADPLKKSLKDRGIVI